MNTSDIVSLRLQNQYLAQPTFQKVSDVVKHLGAIQAQDYPAAKWALGLRMSSATDANIEAAYNNGEILRTHVMRPTWHFVMPQDIRWMLELTAPQVKKLLAHYDPKLEITGKLLLQAYKIISDALQGHNYLTRIEIAEQLGRHNIIVHGQRLGHIVMHAEIDGLICSGPRKGKQFSYALIAERAPNAKKLSREESLATLAAKYFTSHGPAQLKDFAWWSGLTMKDATEGLHLIKDQLLNETIDEKTYWFFPTQKVIRQPSPTAYLLSIYDEYTIAYKDRSALGGERYVEQFISMGNALTAVIILDGLIVGTWKRSLKKNSVEIKLSLLKKITQAEYKAIEQAAELYRIFLGMDAVNVQHKH